MADELVADVQLFEDHVEFVALADVQHEVDVHWKICARRIVTLSESPARWLAMNRLWSMTPCL